MLLQVALFHYFLWLSDIPLYIYYIFFIHSSVDGYLVCFHVLAFGNSVPVNSGCMLLLISCELVSHSLRPLALLHARFPCPLPFPRVCPSLCSLHGDTIQLSHPLSPSSPSAFNLSQHQGLFQWVGCSHQVAKVLELQLQHQSFQWVFTIDFL